MNKTVLDQFEKVLDKMGIRQVLPSQVRRYSIRKKRKTALIVLRHFRECSFGYRIVTKIFYGMRNLGFAISVLQAKIISLLMLGLVSFAAVFGVYASVQYVNKTNFATGQYKTDQRNSKKDMQNIRAVSEKAGEKSHIIEKKQHTKKGVTLKKNNVPEKRKENNAVKIEKNKIAGDLNKEKNKPDIKNKKEKKAERVLDSVPTL